MTEQLNTPSVSEMTGDRHNRNISTHIEPPQVFGAHGLCVAHGLGLAIRHFGGPNNVAQQPSPYGLCAQSEERS
jgi:hypothetical protein